MGTRNLRPSFDRMPWRDTPADLKRWQRGQTGYPIIDAGMCELWITGWMHNRVRMLVASFLTKHLLIHWRHGADWFWDTLVDADWANRGRRPARRDLSAAHGRARRGTRPGARRLAHPRSGTTASRRLRTMRRQSRQVFFRGGCKKNATTDPVRVTAAIIRNGTA